MRLGIAGTNFISDWLLEAAGNVPGIEVCAVFSRKHETGAAFAAKHGIAHIYTEYEEFLNSDIDGVYIATPTYCHCAQALQAMRHGKHVLCEKILAVNTQEVTEMIACAKENEVVLLEAMRPDFDPAFAVIEKNLHKIGRLRRVCIEFCQYSSRYDRFREGEILNAFNPALSNAAIMDIGVYCIHTLVRLFGPPIEVKACSTRLDNGFEGSGQVLMQYPDMIAEAVYSKITDSVNQSILQGEEGTILVDTISKPQKIEIVYRGGTREHIAYEPVANNMEYELREFGRLIREKQVDHPYIRCSLDTAKVVDEARKQNGIVFQADTVL